jgi:rRNA maturation endonuclease Nob1
MAEKREIVINYNFRCRRCHRLGATESGLCLRCGRKEIRESIREYRKREKEARDANAL